jgi:hypothetical protein
MFLIGVLRFYCYLEISEERSSNWKYGDQNEGCYIVQRQNSGLCDKQIRSKLGHKVKKTIIILVY